MQPLASVGNSQLLTNTNLSTMISFSILDQYNNNIPFYANPIEVIIPRDINLSIPSMIMQNVTSTNNYNRSFNFYYVNLTRNNNLTVSFHFEMRPFNTSLAYLLIYKFDTINQIDGWIAFCPSCKLF
jgi:hypothetical protein